VRDATELGQPDDGHKRGRVQLDAVGRKPERSDRGPLSWLLKAGALAGAVTAIAAVVALVKHAASPPAPAVVRVALSDVRTEPHRTEYNYFGSHPASLRREEAAFRAEGLSAAEISSVLRQRGVTVQFTVEPHGPSDHAWYVTEVLYDHATGRREPRIDGNFLDDFRFVPNAGERAVTFPSWIEYPSRPGSYFVEIEVSDEKGTNAAAVSAPFRSPG
jgi:hypothetical protein